jgi:hypothetical protein
MGFSGCCVIRLSEIDGSHLTGRSAFKGQPESQRIPISLPFSPGIMAAIHDAKSKDLDRNTKEYGDPKNRITTDWGVKVSTTDDWLKAASDDKQGPLLLEDPIAREKVPATLVLTILVAFSDSDKDTSIRPRAYS